VQERIDLVPIEQEQKAGGLSLSVIVSVVLHSILLIWFLHSYRPGAPAEKEAPMTRYVELMAQNRRDFTEAPGPAAQKHAQLNAPFSDKNRKASMPEPTGPNPTTRPGDGGGLYTPPMGNPAPRGPRASAPQSQSQSMQTQQPMPQMIPTTGTPAPQPPNDGTFVYREPAQASAAATGAVNWRSAIKEVGKVASLGGGDGIDLQNLGGEKGFAEQGPLSFETQWYDWGDYAQSMVSKIRVNWYANMPQLIRTGMKGVVTIRFTIHRDGRISDITILQSSGVPPYDQAARKAIELSSPLKALPADFPNPQERVTCMFYYNQEIPRD
jgi:TonB family protein